MFLEEKNEATVRAKTTEERFTIYTLMRSYVEHSCKQSRVVTAPDDLEQEIEVRLTKILS